MTSICKNDPKYGVDKECDRDRDLETCLADGIQLCDQIELRSSSTIFAKYLDVWKNPHWFPPDGSATAILYPTNDSDSIFTQRAEKSVPGQINKTAEEDPSNAISCFASNPWLHKECPTRKEMNAIVRMQQALLIYTQDNRTAPSVGLQVQSLMDIFGQILKACKQKESGARMQVVYESKLFLMFMAPDCVRILRCTRTFRKFLVESELAAASVFGHTSDPTINLTSEEKLLNSTDSFPGCVRWKQLHASDELPLHCRSLLDKCRSYYFFSGYAEVSALLRALLALDEPVGSTKKVPRHFAVPDLFNVGGMERITATFPFLACRVDPGRLVWSFFQKPGNASKSEATATCLKFTGHFPPLSLARFTTAAIDTRCTKNEIISLKFSTTELFRSFWRDLVIAGIHLPRILTDLSIFAPDISANISRLLPPTAVDCCAGSTRETVRIAFLGGARSSNRSCTTEKPTLEPTNARSDPRRFVLLADVADTQIADHALRSCIASATEKRDLLLTYRKESDVFSKDDDTKQTDQIDKENAVPLQDVIAAAPGNVVGATTNQAKEVPTKVIESSPAAIPRGEESAEIEPPETREFREVECPEADTTASTFLAKDKVEEVLCRRWSKLKPSFDSSVKKKSSARAPPTLKKGRKEESNATARSVLKRQYDEPLKVEHLDETQRQAFDFSLGALICSIGPFPFNPIKASLPLEFLHSYSTLQLSNADFFVTSAMTPVDLPREKVRTCIWLTHSLQLGRPAVLGTCCSDICECQNPSLEHLATPLYTPPVEQRVPQQQKRLFFVVGEPAVADCAGALIGVEQVLLRPEILRQKLKQVALKQVLWEKEALKKIRHKIKSKFTKATNDVYGSVELVTPQETPRNSAAHNSGCSRDHATQLDSVRTTTTTESFFTTDTFHLPAATHHFGSHTEMYLKKVMQTAPQFRVHAVLILPIWKAEITAEVSSTVEETFANVERAKAGIWSYEELEILNTRLKESEKVTSAMLDVISLLSLEFRYCEPANSLRRALGLCNEDFEGGARSDIGSRLLLSIVSLDFLRSCYLSNTVDAANISRHRLEWDIDEKQCCRPFKFTQSGFHRTVGPLRNEDTFEGPREILQEKLLPEMFDCSPRKVHCNVSCTGEHNAGVSSTTQLLSEPPLTSGMTLTEVEKTATAAETAAHHCYSNDIDRPSITGDSRASPDLYLRPGRHRVPRTSAVRAALISAFFAADETLLNDTDQAHDLALNRKRHNSSNRNSAVRKRHKRQEP